MRFARDLNCRGRSRELVDVRGIVLPVGLNPLDDRTFGDHALVLERAMVTSWHTRLARMPRMLGVLDRYWAWIRRGIAAVSLGPHDLERSCSRCAIAIGYADRRSRFAVGLGSIIYPLVACHHRSIARPHTLVQLRAALSGPSTYATATVACSIA